MKQIDIFISREQIERERQNKMRMKKGKRKQAYWAKWLFHVHKLLSVVLINFPIQTARNKKQAFECAVNSGETLQTWANNSIKWFMKPEGLWSINNFHVFLFFTRTILLRTG